MAALSSRAPWRLQALPGQDAPEPQRSSWRLLEEDCGGGVGWRERRKTKPWRQAKCQLSLSVGISEERVGHVSASAPPDSAPGRASPVYTPKVEALLDSMKWDANGLVVAIAQHAGTGAVLMQGFADRAAVSATLASRRATFYSRSRKSLWTKGETSENFINVVDVYLDCDKDSIIYMGLPDGPTCHTGAETCYYTRVDEYPGEQPVSEAHSAAALSTLYLLEATIAQRQAEAVAEASGELPSAGKPSWTRKLLDSPNLLCAKIREEANELCQTLERDEGKERTASEMADVLYHALVLLAVQDVKFEDVTQKLRARFTKSGIEEKQGRKK